MIDFIHQHIIPATYSLLPKEMNSPQATAMLLAIGLQESRFEHRVQANGPARGFWQFERNGGVRGVVFHPKTGPIVNRLYLDLKLGDGISLPSHETIYHAIAWNDVLACAMARLLLWSSPVRLNGSNESELAWALYLHTWNPGRPHPESWSGCYSAAWDRVRRG